MIPFLLLAACSSPPSTTIGHLGAYAHGEMGLGLSVARVTPTSSNTSVTVETRSADGGSWSAKLNVAAGADDGDIYSSIDAADAWLRSKGGTLPLGKRSDATATDLASLIDDWNNGGTGPGHCD